MAQQQPALPGMRKAVLFGQLKLLPLDTAVTANDVDVANMYVGHFRRRQPVFSYTVRIHLTCSHANIGKLAFRDAFHVEMPCSAEVLAIQDGLKREEHLKSQEIPRLRPILRALEQQMLGDFIRGEVSLVALMKAFRQARQQAASVRRLRITPI